MRRRRVMLGEDPEHQFATARDADLLVVGQAPVEAVQLGEPQASALKTNCDPDNVLVGNRYIPPAE